MDKRAVGHAFVCLISALTVISGSSLGKSMLQQKAGLSLRPFFLGEKGKNRGVSVRFRANTFELGSADRRCIQSTIKGKVYAFVEEPVTAAAGIQLEAVEGGAVKNRAREA